MEKFTVTKEQLTFEQMTLQSEVYKLEQERKSLNHKIRFNKERIENLQVQLNECTELTEA